MTRAARHQLRAAAPRWGCLGANGTREAVLELRWTSLGTATRIGQSTCGGRGVAGRAPRPARDDLGVEVHLRAADGRAASERAGRSAQERFVPFERLTAPTDGNKFGTISGLKCGSSLFCMCAITCACACVWVNHMNTSSLARGHHATGWLHFYRRHESSLFTTGLPRDPPTQPQPPPARGQHPYRWCCEGLAPARLYWPSRRSGGRLRGAPQCAVRQWCMGRRSGSARRCS